MHFRPKFLHEPRKMLEPFRLEKWQDLFFLFNAEAIRLQ